MEDGSPTLEVGFQIDFGDSFGGLKTLDDLIGKAAADGVRQFQQLERAVAGGLGLPDAAAQFRAFGSTATRAGEDARKAYNTAEKAGESMVRQIERQTETFGKTAAEVRNMRAEMKAAAADAQGLTELATRIRAANAALVEMEGAANGAAHGSSRMSASGQEMMHVARASADAFAAGAPALQIFSMEIGRVAQAAATAGGGTGALGAIGGFLGGPWGVALTVGIAVLGPLIAGLFDTSEAAKQAADSLQKFEERQADMGRFIDANTGKLKEQSRVLAQIAVQQSGSQLQAAAKPGLDAVSGAFAAARAQLASAGSSRAGPGDVELSRVILNANGNVQLLNQGIQNLVAHGRTGLASLANTTAGFAGQAQEAADAIHRVQGNQAALNTTLHGGTVLTGALVDRQVAWATATTAVERAQAKLSDIQARKSAIEEMPYGAKQQAAWQQYKTDVVAATGAVKIAEAAQKSAKKTGDSHAITLARQADAMNVSADAAINAASAYLTSSAAGATAEARRKALTDATKKGIDVDAQVARQMQLAAAEATLNGAKTVSQLGDESSARDAVLAKVQAGTVAVGAMDEALKVDLALRPLLAARTQLHGDALKVLNDVIAATPGAFAQAQASANRFDLTKVLQAGEDQLAQLREEATLIGANTDARVHELAVLKAMQDEQKQGITATPFDAVVQQAAKIADQAQANLHANDAYNASLTETADHWEIIAGKVQAAGQGMADAFGSAGRAIGDVASTYASYMASQSRLEAEHKRAIDAAGKDQQLIAQANQRFALQSSGAQVAAYGDMIGAAKGFFKEGTAGYDALAAAEKIYRVAQFAMSIQAMVQSVRETFTHVAGAAARSTANAAEGVSAQAKLPFPFNLVAMAATAAALVAAGIAVIGGSGGGSASHIDPGNTGIGTVLGSTTAGSDSIKNSIDALGKIDLLTNSYSREMAASLKSIDSQIGSFAAEIVKGGDINASANIATGFKTSGLGSILSNIPLIGGFLSSLFGTRTDITGGGLYGAPQTVGQIEASGYTGQSYSDVEKTHKFLGIVTGRSYSTQYGGLDPSVDSQFTLILQSFDKAIAAAAGPLGDATDAVQARLDSFVVDIGKINLQGLSGDDIEKKLENVFGALGDQMASFVYPEIIKFQKVGEGALETLTRVASTVESVTTALDELGSSSAALGIDAKMGLAAQFDSLSDMSSAVDAYFHAYYSSEEQAAAKTAQMAKVFDSLGLSMPSSLAGFRQLVEAQDLTTTAGQSTYATLLQLAPAFADLNATMDGAKSAADILSERADLQKQIWQATGDTASIRAAELAALDPSNRALQQRLYDLADEATATDAANRVAQERSGLETTLLQLQGDTITQRQNEIAALDPANRALQEQVFALQDQQAAAAAAAQADQAAAQAAAAVAQERSGIEQQLLQLQGDTVALRQRELAALDPTNRAIQQQVYDLTDLQAAQAAAAQAEQDAAQAAAAVAQERTGLEGQLLQLQGDTVALRQRELAALDPTNRAIQDQIYALTDLQTAQAAAAQAEQEAAQAAAAVAQERTALEGQLLQLQGDTVALRQRELAALDPTNRAIQEQIYALTDLQAAQQAATQAEQEAAQAAAAIAQQRAGIQQQLWQLIGDTASIRAAELDQLDPTNRALQEQVYALQDQQAAAEAASQAAQQAAQSEQALAQERAGLMQQLWQLTGDTASIRAAQLASLDPSNRALQEQIYAVSDAQDAAKAAQALADAWTTVGDSIKAEIDRIRGAGDTGTASFASLQGQFNAAIAAATGGDQDAAKSLPDLSKSLLDAAALAATSRQELERIEAQTAGALQQVYDMVGSTVGASNAATSAMPGATASNDNASSSADQWWSTFSAAASAASPTGGNDDLLTELRDLRAEVAGMRAENNKGHATTADGTGKTASMIDRAQRKGGGDSIAVVQAA